MGIYLPNMEMPKVGVKNIMIISNGRVFQLSGYRNPKPLGIAIHVPPHGRLIDADALIEAHEQVCSRSMKFNLDLAPTVIPASEEGET